MKKRSFKLVIMLMVLTIIATLFSGCSLSCVFGSHKWVNATCTKAKYCKECKKTVGKPLGHKWVDATCTEPKHCSVCNKTVGGKAGHTTQLGVCDNCGEYINEASDELDSINHFVDNLTTYLQNGQNYIISSSYPEAVGQYTSAASTIGTILDYIDDIDTNELDGIYADFSDAKSYFESAIDDINDANVYQFSNTTSELQSKNDALSSIKSGLTSTQTAIEGLADVSHEIANN